MPNPKILNPDSTVLQQIEGQWQKFAMLILWKLNEGKVVRITAKDMQNFAAAYAPGIPCMFTHGMNDAIEFSIVDEEAAGRLVDHDKTMRGNA